MRRFLGLFVVVFAVAALTSACGGDDDGPPHRKLDVVGVEMSFDAPDSVKAGTYDVTFHNKGTVYHELAFNDPSGKTVARRSIAGGTSVTFEVELKAGTYELVCREPGHYQSGMHRPLEVT